MGKPGKGHALSSQSERIALWKQTEGSEPSQYLQEEKATAIPLVAASERGRAQTGEVSSLQVLLLRCRGMLLDPVVDGSGSYKTPA